MRCRCWRTDIQINSENRIGDWSGSEFVIHIANWEEHCLKLFQHRDRVEHVTRIVTTENDVGAGILASV